MTEQNRKLAVRWFEEVWNRQSEATIDEIMAPNSVGHMEGIEVVGPQEFKNVRATLLKAFPDLQLTVEATAADGDAVVARWRATGTHRGPVFGIEGTGAQVAFKGMTWLVIKRGQLVEGWDAWNQGALAETLRLAIGAKSRESP
jgi:predicted ester cyclase